MNINIIMLKKEARHKRDCKIQPVWNSRKAKLIYNNRKQTGSWLRLETGVVARADYTEAGGSFLE